ncbi:MAG: DUF192 domain-containing protein [Candidatus Saccharimonadales bacterium]
MQNKETKKTESARKQQGPLIYIVSSIVIVLLLIGGFFMFQKKLSVITYKTVTISNEKFNLEVADTDAKRAKGLSERDSIPQNGGMFFDYKSEGDWRMWMVQMRFPIDIAWLKKDGTIVYIKHNAQPGDYPEIYHANQNSYYTIEVPAGTFDRLNVKEGAVIRIN